MFKYTVLFDDNAKAYVTAYDISEAWEKALDVPHHGKVVDVWLE